MIKILVLCMKKTIMNSVTLFIKYGNKWVYKLDRVPTKNCKCQNIIYVNIFYNSEGALFCKTQL